jgi:hypothetical protein
MDVVLNTEIELEDGSTLSIKKSEEECRKEMIFDFTAFCKAAQQGENIRYQKSMWRHAMQNYFNCNHPDKHGCDPMQSGANIFLELGSFGQDFKKLFEDQIAISEGRKQTNNTIVILNGEAGAGKDTFGDLLVERYGYIKLAYAKHIKEKCSKKFGLPLNFFYDSKLKDKALSNFPVRITDEFSRVIINEMCTHLKTFDGRSPELRFSEDGTMIKPPLHLSDECYVFINGNIHLEENRLFHTPRSIAIIEACCKRAIDPDWWCDKAYKPYEPRVSFGKPTRLVVIDDRFWNEVERTRNVFQDVKLVVAVHIKSRFKNPHSDATENGMKGCKFDYEIDNSIEGKQHIEPLFAKFVEFLGLEKAAQ